MISCLIVSCIEGGMNGSLFFSFIMTSRRKRCDQALPAGPLPRQAAIPRIPRSRCVFLWIPDQRTSELRGSVEVSYPELCLRPRKVRLHCQPRR
jgi:hypothetical protein